MFEKRKWREYWNVSEKKYYENGKNCRVKRLKVPAGFFCPRNISMIKLKGMWCEIVQAAGMHTEYWVRKAGVITQHGNLTVNVRVILNWVLTKTEFDSAGCIKLAYMKSKASSWKQGNTAMGSSKGRKQLE